MAVLALLAAFATARGPVHRATLALPVSNDDAILLLMGRHVLRGELATTLWNQPYNGALDAYLLAPLLAVLPAHAAYRLYEALCAALLVALVGLLARRLGGPTAGWAGALLAAWGTPYMALMTATGPPPNFLMPLVTGFPLVAALAVLPREAAPLGRGAALGLGLACGLAVWNSSLAIPAFAGMAAGLALAGLRPRLSSALAFASGLALGAAPLLVARTIGASGARVVTASSAVTALRPRWLWEEGLSNLGHALRGLAGLQVPLVVDGKERAELPTALVALLVSGLVVAVAAGCRSRRVLPLAGWAGALAGAFWLSRRTGPDDLRYLYGLHAPLLALAGAGLAALWAWRRPAGVAAGLALLLPWGYGQRVLAEKWRDPLHAESAWEVPSLEASVRALRASGARSAYASLQFAGRITLETGEDVIASQAWNERIPGDPLRFRDEVDLDPAPAWVLSTRFSRGMPRAGGFRDLLRAMGGSFEETAVDGFVVFHGLRPPYDESRPVPAAEVRLETATGAPIGPEALDRDPATAWTAAEGLGRGSAVVARVSPPRRLSALVLAVDLETLDARRPVGGVDRRRGGGAGTAARRFPVGERGAAGGQAGAAGRAAGRSRGGRRAPRVPGAGAAAGDRRGLPVRPGGGGAARGRERLRAGRVRVGAGGPLGRGGAPLRAGHPPGARPRLAPRRLAPGPLARGAAAVARRREPRRRRPRARRGAVDAPERAPRAREGPGLLSVPQSPEESRPCPLRSLACPLVWGTRGC